MTPDSAERAELEPGFYWAEHEGEIMVGLLDCDEHGGDWFFPGWPYPVSVDEKNVTVLSPRLAAPAPPDAAT
jgi:hypothetical protein